MLTLHSIDLKAVDDPCFGSVGSACRVLSVKDERCGCECPFYKPKECRDWVRIEDGYGINLVPMEEFREYYRRRHEQRKSLRMQKRFYRI